MTRIKHDAMFRRNAKCVEKPNKAVPEVFHGVTDRCMVDGD